MLRLNLPDNTVAEIRFTEKPNNKTQVTVQLNKLPDAATAEEKKKFWKEILNCEDWKTPFQEIAAQQ